MPADEPAQEALCGQEPALEGQDTSSAVQEAGRAAELKANSTVRRTACSVARSKENVKFICYDCKQRTFDWYMLKDAVWCTAFPDYSEIRCSLRRQLGKSARIFLCYSCVERRLGRALVADDFRLDLPISSGILQGMRMGKKIIENKPMEYRKKFKPDDEVVIKGQPDILCVVTGYFDQSNSHCYVESDLTRTRLIVPQEDLRLVDPCPYRVVIRVLVGKRPPFWFRGDPAKLCDVLHGELQSWVGSNLQPSMKWSTAIGVLDAARSLVKEALDNGNFSKDVAATIDGQVPVKAAQIRPEG